LTTDLSLVKRIRAQTLVPICRLWTSAFLMLATLSFPSPSTASPGSDPRATATPTPFSAVFNAHFKQWDLDGNGELLGSELGTGIADPAKHQEEAAALAALDQVERDSPWNLTFTMSDIEEYERGCAKHKRLGDYDKRYARCRQKLSVASHALYAHTAPHFDAVQLDLPQSPVMTILVSATLHQPQTITRMIRDNHDGSYTFSAPGKKPVILSQPTDGELADFSGAGADGTWLNLLEKGYCLTFKTRRSDLECHRQIWPDAAMQATKILTRLTGHRPTVLLLNGKSDKASVETLRTHLAEALRQHAIIICTSPNNMFAVLNYDRKTDCIQLWNPTSSDLGAPTTKFGQTYATTIPLAQFAAKFAAVVVSL
jgi:hypothetical protein